MDADSLAKVISSAAALVFPAAAGWAWKTQQTVTEHSTLLIERKEAEEDWKRDLKERLSRIEDKLDERKP